MQESNPEAGATEVSVLELAGGGGVLLRWPAPEDPEEVIQEAWPRPKRLPAQL